MHGEVLALRVDADLAEELVASSGEVLAAGGAATKTSLGPKVLSSLFGPNAPACSGPLTNSQNGSKSVNPARAGS